MKKIITVLCTLVLLLSLSACGENSTESLMLESDMKYEAEVAFSLVESSSTEEQFSYLETLSAYEWMVVSSNIKSNYGITIEKTTILDGIESYRNASKVIGDIVLVDDPVYEVDEDEAIVSMILHGSEGMDAKFIVYVNDSYEITGCQTDVQYTLGQKMAGAAMNTLLGMGTVFVILILISLIISCFQYIPKIQSLFEKKDSLNDQFMDQAIAQITTKEEEELVDDTELVAVIAAAIAAYEGTDSTDGFTVRSIRKSNVSKWKNSLK